jgi:hypothetical protein
MLLLLEPEMAPYGAKHKRSRDKDKGKEKNAFAKMFDGDAFAGGNYFPVFGVV